MQYNVYISMTDYEELAKYKGDRTTGQFLAEIVREKIESLRKDTNVK